MRVEFINPFLDAAVNVIHTMAFISPSPGNVSLKTQQEAKGDITGIIGLTGSVQGSLAVSFSESCALKIVENMLGEKFDALNDQVADAVGELTNMISGDARSKLQKLGYNVTAAIPAVIRGKGHTVKHIAPGKPIILIPFSTADGDFFVEASLSS